MREGKAAEWKAGSEEEVNDGGSMFMKVHDSAPVSNEAVAKAETIRGSSIEDLSGPLFIAWQINSACNLGCLHCCEEAGHSFPDEMTREEALALCGQFGDFGIPYVALSGGEPLMHPHFFDMCEHVRAHDISLKVETNGEFIDEGVACRLAALGFRSVQVSLDGATPETHNRLRERGDWHKTINACRLLMEAGVNTEIVFVPTQFNIHEVGDVIDLANALKVYGFYTGKTMRIGRAAQNWDIICPSEEQYEIFFRVLQAKEQEYSGRMKVYFYPYDVIEELKYRLECPAASLLVLPNGKVKLIGPLPFLCGDLRKHCLEEIWTNYKRAWKDPRVSAFARRLIDNPLMLAEANKWVELY